MPHCTACLHPNLKTGPGFSRSLTGLAGRPSHPRLLTHDHGPTGPYGPRTRVGDSGRLRGKDSDGTRTAGGLSVRSPGALESPSERRNTEPALALGGTAGSQPQLDDPQPRSGPGSRQSGHRPPRPATAGRRHSRPVARRPRAIPTRITQAQRVSRQAQSGKFEPLLHSNVRSLYCSRAARAGLEGKYSTPIRVPI